MKKYIYNHDYNASNYFFISNQIKRLIPNYYFYFHLPIQQDFLDRLFIEINVNDQSNICYQMFSFHELTTKQHSQINVPLYNKLLYYFFNITRSICMLLNANIILNLRESNILFHGDSIYLTNFFDSLSLVNYNNNHGKSVFKNIYSYCSFEYFVCYQIFVKQNLHLKNMLLQEHIDNIIIEFLEYHILFKFEVTIQNQKYTDYFQKEASQFFLSFLNKPIQILVDCMFKSYQTWDCFTFVSYMILKFNESQINESHIIEKMDKFNQLLINSCLHVNASKRITMEQITQYIEKEFNNSQ